MSNKGEIRRQIANKEREKQVKKLTTNRFKRGFRRLKDAFEKLIQQEKILTKDRVVITKQKLVLRLERRKKD